MFCVRSCWRLVRSVCGIPTSPYPSHSPSHQEKQEQEQEEDKEEDKEEEKEEDKEEEKETNKEDKKTWTWKNTVPFVPPFTSGMVIKVYDGDTITIASRLPIESSPVYRMSVRLNGIDCPEMKTLDNREKQCAMLAKEEMARLVLGKEIVLKNTTTEKYGRLLADVYVDGLHVNQHMLDKRLAVPYGGNTKQKVPDWMAFHEGREHAHNGQRSGWAMLRLGLLLRPRNRKPIQPNKTKTKQPKKQRN